MKTTLAIPVKRTKHSRLSEFDFEHIDFGRIPTDHIFIAEYKNGEWHNARVEPFGNLSISPMSLGLHYGQTVFEGLKAFRSVTGDINVFRVKKHFERFNLSLERMCMPAVPESLFTEAIHALVETDQKWVPGLPDSSLYIRPFMIATESKIGVKVSDEYLFMVVCSPMGKYYSKNLKVKVETDFVRAVEGGTGSAKCSGNYGASFYPTRQANKEGFDQVLWTDGKHNEFIEESGTMNVMFVIDDVLVTPPLNGNILDGVTRNSLISLAKQMGVKVEERNISYKELERAFAEGKKVEAFGAGTAAVIAPIESIHIQGISYSLPVKENALMFRLKQQLNDIRTGKVPDTFHWNHKIAGEA